MHQRKGSMWPFPSPQPSPSLTNSDANSTRSSSRYKSSLVSLCSICQVHMRYRLLWRTGKCQRHHCWDPLVAASLTYSIWRPIGPYSVFLKTARYYPKSMYSVFWPQSRYAFSNNELLRRERLRFHLMDNPVFHKINNWPGHKALRNLDNITALDL